MAASILVAEDQTDIRELLVMNLRGAGYEVEAVADGPSALASQRERASDLLVLDLMMPGLDGLEVCKALRAREEHADPDAHRQVDRARPGARPRARRRRLPDQAVLAGRAAGAGEGAAAPRRPAACRPGNVGGEGRVLRNGDLEIQPAKRQVRFRGAAIDFTALEFDLLLHFASHPGHVFSRAQLLDAVWGYSHDGYEHTVTTHINRLRNKLEVDPMRPELILTVRGAGYKMRDSP